MINAFYNGAAALRAQQTAIDITSNNISNVNTNGFKEKQASFSDLLYSTVSAYGNVGANTTAGAAAATAGSGVGVTGTKTDLTQGSGIVTGHALDYLIPANGYFELRDASGNLTFTRSGSFQASKLGQTNVLTDSQGREVLSAGGNVITIGADGKPQGAPGVFSFANEQGLNPEGGSLFTQTALSGAPAATAVVPVSGELEGSNTDLASQLTELMVAERAYQLGSKSVQTADSIEEMANQLR